jgi:hypothetical protein
MSFAGLTDKDREGLNTLEARQRGFDCGVGSYCGDQIGTTVGTGSAARTIFHRTSTTISNNKATTDVYILSDGNWVKAATTTDGGKTYSYNESTRPDGSKIVGTGVRQSLASGGNMNSNVKAQVTRTLQKGGANLTSEPKLTNNQIQEVGAVASNNATTTIDSDILSSAIGDGREGTRNEFRGASGKDPLKYPLNLKSEHQDVIKFQMLKYEPKKFDQQKFGFSERSRTIESTIGTVVLPIPAGISDQNAVTWSDGTMNAANAALANLALSGIEGGGEGLTNTATNIANTVVGASDDVKKAIAASFASQATGVAGILARTTGAIINPNLELLFNAPTLRPFNFTFKLSARSKREAEAIRSIIRFFKQGMSPIRTESNLFLKAPHTFQLQYLHRGKQHNYLNKFKECALQSFSVDYTPEGQYATFTDGAMVSYQITMQFQELEPVFNDDYGLGSGSGSSGYDTEIGF